MQKWISHDISVKSSKISTAKIGKAKIEIFLYDLKVLDNTFNLIPYLLKLGK